jgi:hypothetical protein
MLAQTVFRGSHRRRSFSCPFQHSGISPVLSIVHLMVTTAITRFAVLCNSTWETCHFITHHRFLLPFLLYLTSPSVPSASSQPHFSLCSSHSLLSTLSALSALLCSLASRACAGSRQGARGRRRRHDSRAGTRHGRGGGGAAAEGVGLTTKRTSAWADMLWECVGSCGGFLPTHPILLVFLSFLPTFCFVFFFCAASV